MKRHDAAVVEALTCGVYTINDSGQLITDKATTRWMRERRTVMAKHRKDVEVEEPIYLFTGIDDRSLILFTVWADGTAQVAYRPSEDVTWGPPIELNRAEVG